MLPKSRNVWPYLAIVALSVALVANVVIATPRTGYENGFPGRVEDRLDEVQAQINDFRGYVETNTADLFDISSAICFTGTLGAGADVGLGVNGDLHAGIGTGVDLYGLLDIDAGVGIQGAVDLNAALNAGLAGSVQICLNAGILKVRTDGSIELAGGIVVNPDTAIKLNELGQNAINSAVDVYHELPTVIDTFDINPDVVLTGFDAVAELASRDLGTAITDSLNPANWDDIVADLPGGMYISDEVDSVFDSFNQLGDGDVCGFMEGLGGTVDAGVGDTLYDICAAVPDGVNTSLAGITDTVDVVYSGLILTIGYIQTAVDAVYGFMVDTVWDFLVNTINPAVNGIKSAVDSVKSVVDSIRSALP